MSTRRYAGYLILLAAGLTGCADSSVLPIEERLDPAAIAANNRAVGLMGQFEYTQAQAIFSDLLGQWPDWLDVQTNLAVATLNRQQVGDEQLALGLLGEVLEADPTDLRAHYVTGLLQLYLGSPAEALEHFSYVVENDPDDAFAAYYRAQCLAQLGNDALALTAYEQAMGLDPYLRSAYYGAFQSLQRLGRGQEATDRVDDFQRLENNPRSHLAEFRYTRMGGKGEALAIDLSAESPLPQPAGELFSEPTLLPITESTPLPWREPRADRMPSLTTVDMQGDGSPDLFLAGVVAVGLDGDAAGNLILEGQPDGGYRVATDHPLAAVSDVNAALWGDFDNDGLIDVYLCRRGRNQLWQQNPGNVWRNVTASTGTAAANLDTVDGAFLDADHDGDLDLFLVNGDGPNELLNNNLDGTFRPLAMEYDLGGGDTASRMIVPADLDSDRDVDLIVLNRTPPHRVYINDRLWSYQPGTGYDAFNNHAATSMVAADVDADGAIELYTSSDTGELLRWEAGADGQIGSESLGYPEVLGGVAEASLSTQDVDGDGVIDLIVASPRGWAVFTLGTGTVEELFAVLAEPESPHTASLPLIGGSGSGPAMLVYSASLVNSAANYGLTLWQPGPGRFPFISLELSGIQADAESMRSNASGVGTQLAVRVDSRWSRLDTYRNHSAPGQSLQPLAVGLGGAPRADFISIDWSDGVFQSEIDVEAGTLERITETQRQLSSCPVLFAWNGSEYAFVSDILGVGGMGYAIGPGEYASPRPWENFLLPPGSVQPRNDRYEFKVAEPMEEIAYLDAARLAIYDLPPSWQMVMDDRMGIADPEPTGQARFYRNELRPSHAENDRGDDVTATVLTRDGIAAPVGDLDRRFIGRLQTEHVLTLEFPQPLDRYPGEPLLVVDGWVEYPYSQTNFAAWQADARFEAPSLDAAVGDGPWESVVREFGYPAGMPRRMSLPLAGLPDGTDRLRLRTNMQVYWDRITVAFAEPLPAHRMHLMPVVAATFRKSGFARRTTHAQFRPHYDYGESKPFWDTRYMAGYYTRMGPVDALVHTVDDAVAIIGPGEEVHLEFETVEAAAPGWTRVFVLETHGWAKDMDLFTRDGDTVSPLPTTGKPDDVRDDLHAQYNTRYQSGR